jgi:hypothetical protein
VVDRVEAGAAKPREATVTPTTLSLLDWQPPVAAPRAPEQPANLARVSGELAPIVLDFAREHVGREFVEGYFTEWVTSRRPGGKGAKGSPTRILRDLKGGGFVSYTVVNRAASLYRIDAVKQEEHQP